LRGVPGPSWYSLVRRDRVGGVSHEQRFGWKAHCSARHESSLRGSALTWIDIRSACIAHPTSVTILPELAPHPVQHRGFAGIIATNAPQCDCSHEGYNHPAQRKQRLPCPSWRVGFFRSIGARLPLYAACSPPLSWPLESPSAPALSRLHFTSSDGKEDSFGSDRLKGITCHPSCYYRRDMQGHSSRLWCLLLVRWG